MNSANSVSVHVNIVFFILMQDDEWVGNAEAGSQQRHLSACAVCKVSSEIFVAIQKTSTKHSEHIM